MKRGRAGGDCAARGVSEESGGGRVISAPTASERLRPLCCTARRACWCSWWRWHPGSGCRSWRGPALEGRVGCVRVCWVGGCVGELGCPPPSVPSPPPNSPPHTRCQLTLLAAGGAAGVPLCCCAAVATRSPKYPSTHKHDQRRPGSGDQGMPRPSAHGPPPAPAAPPAPPARPTNRPTPPPPDTHHATQQVQPRLAAGLQHPAGGGDALRADEHGAGGAAHSRVASHNGGASLGRAADVGDGDRGAKQAAAAVEGAQAVALMPSGVRR